MLLELYSKCTKCGHILNELINNLSIPNDYGLGPAVYNVYVTEKPRLIPKSCPNCKSYTMYMDMEWKEVKEEEK